MEKRKDGLKKGKDTRKKCGKKDTYWASERAQAFTHVLNLISTL